MEDGESSGDFFNCGVCRHVASNAVECTTCWNIFCESCLNNLPDNVCPRCMTQPRNTRPAEFARQLINDIKGDCPFQCGVRMGPREFPCHRMRCPNAPNVQHGEVMNLIDQALDPEVLIYHLSCQVCFMLASEPVHCLTCHKVFCTTCFTENQMRRCPGCSARADYYPAHLARRMIGEIKVLCPNNGCGRETTLPQLVDHLRSCEMSTKGCNDHEHKQRRRKKFARVALGLVGGAMLIGGGVFIAVKVAPLAIPVVAPVLRAAGTKVGTFIRIVTNSRAAKLFVNLLNALAVVQIVHEIYKHWNDTSDDEGEKKGEDKEGEMKSGDKEGEMKSGDKEGEMKSGDKEWKMKSGDKEGEMKSEDEERR